MNLPLNSTGLGQALPRSGAELPGPDRIAGQGWGRKLQCLGDGALGFAAQSWGGSQKNGSDGPCDSSREPHFHLCGGGGQDGKLETHFLDRNAKCSAENWVGLRSTAVIDASCAPHPPLQFCSSLGSMA